ncbi:MAG: beta-lactamase family protein, partial [Syntrophales bacterium]|nr:beta-lactamase family protein [Syntrophales bacterium]
MTACTQPENPTQGDVQAFTAFLEQYIPGRLEKYEIPGAAVALVHGGEVVYHQAYGLRDIELNQPATDGDLWQVGSLSKSTTAWGVMKLVETGKIELEAPVETYLKSWHLPPSEFDNQQVTIRRLLTHSAGLSITPYAGLPKGTPAPSLPEFFQLAAEQGNPLYVQYPPGSAFRYSDNDYHLLQLVIEDLTGEPFAQYMQREVLQPLGMLDSWHEFTPEVESRMGWGYNSLFEGLEEYSYAQKAAAGLFTSVQDMGTYATAIMPGPDGEPVGRGVLKPETVAQMLAAQVELAGFEKVLFKGNYGYGYIREQLPGGVTVISHPGGNPGWIAELVILPESGDGLVVFTNIAHGYVLFADLVDRWMERLGYDSPYVARLILASGVVFDLLGSVLVGGSLLLLGGLAVAIIRGRRVVAIRKVFRPVWRGALLVLLPLLA